MTAAVAVPWTPANVARMARAVPDQRSLDVIASDDGVTLLDFREPPMLMAVRAEQGDHGPEVCVVAIEGRNVLTHWPAFEQLCRDNGFVRIRGHADVNRPAIPRLWRRIGFEPAETVFYRDL